MRKAWIVAKHEFTVTVKRVWFIVATFGFPLLFLAIGGTITLLAKRTIETKQAEMQAKPFGIVDRSGLLTRTPTFLHVRYDSEEEGRRAIAAKEISAFLLVEKDYLETGETRLYTAYKPNLFSQELDPTPNGLESWMIENVLAGAEERRVALAKNPMPNRRAVYLDEKAQESKDDALAAMKRTAVAYGFFMLLFMATFISSAYLLQGMADEKENRVMEIILSSATPVQLMLGKLIGLGAAGLLQLAVWVTMGLVGVAAFVVEIVIEPTLVLFCLVYFLFGYTMFGSLMLGFGSLGTNFRESQQMASVWTMIGVSPMMIHFVIAHDPQATIARVFSYIPFTAPATMMLRYALDPKGTPLLDIIASLVLVAATTYFAVKFSARLYRVGLLLYGKRPGVREIWRWLRAAN